MLVYSLLYPIASPENAIPSCLQATEDAWSFHLLLLEKKLQMKFSCSSYEVNVHMAIAPS